MERSHSNEISRKEYILPNNNIIVLDSTSSKPYFLVRESNATMVMILYYYSLSKELSRFHKFSAIATHVIEGPLSFLVFCPDIARIFGFFLFFGLMLMINVTGNYGFLGFLTTVQSVTLLEDSFYFNILGMDLPAEW